MQCYDIRNSNEKKRKKKKLIISLEANVCILKWKLFKFFKRSLETKVNIISTLNSRFEERVFIYIFVWNREILLWCKEKKSLIKRIYKRIFALINWKLSFKFPDRWIFPKIIYHIHRVTINKITPKGKKKKTLAPSTHCTSLYFHSFHFE